MARIVKVSKQQDGSYKGKISIEVDKIYNTGSTAMAGSARYKLPNARIDSPTVNIHNAEQGWFAPPLVGDRFVLIQYTDMLWWYNMFSVTHPEANLDLHGMPAPITAFELTQDTEFIRFNQLLKNKINSSLSLLPASIKRKSAPALFHQQTTASVEAFVPNGVNCQQIDGGTFYPKQFGPRDGSNLDVFSKAFMQTAPNSTEIDDWYYFHLYWGEIHCGSNVERQSKNEWWKTTNTK